MNNYFPLICHTDYSLMTSTIRINEIPKICKEYGLSGCAITDYGSISGAVSFYKEMNKNNLKPILGCKLYLCEQHPEIKTPDNKEVSHITLLCKNRDGWQQLLEITARANSPQFFYDYPRLNLDELERIVGNTNDFIVLTGDIGSQLSVIPYGLDLYNVRCNNDIRVKFKVNRGEPVYKPLKQYYDECISIINRYKKIFSNHNVYLNIQHMNGFDHIAEDFVSFDILPHLSEATNTPRVATCNPHYINQEDYHDHRILLCRKLKVTLRKLIDECDKEDNLWLNQFVNYDRFHFHSFKEMEEISNQDITSEPNELSNSLQIANMCEEYDILRKPVLPTFECPDSADPDEHLRQLCRDGFASHGFTKDSLEYIHRIKYELEVLQEAGLSSYFLVVKDIIDYMKKNNWYTSFGRGCLKNDTPIYLENGEIKNIENVNVGDNVYTQNGNLSKVVNKFKYPIENEQLLNIQCYYGDNRGITLTQNHKILSSKSTYGEIQKYTSCSQLSWKPANELSVSNWVFIPHLKYNIQYDKKIDLGKYSNNKELKHDKIYAHHIKFNGKYKGINSYKRYIPIDEDFMTILGIFTGDGSLSKKHPTILTFCVNDEEPEIKTIIIDYFNKYNIKHTYHNNKNNKGANIDIKCKHFKKLYDELFYKYKCTSITKHVPDLVKHASKKLIEAFVYGYQLADGYMDKYQHGIKTISLTLANDVRYLYSLLNIPSTLTVYKNLPDKRGWITSKYSYSVRIPANKNKGNNFKILKDGILLRIRKIDRIDNIKNVYDLEIDKQHDYLTNSFLVHNSAAGCLTSYLLGITKIDPIEYKLMFSRFYNKGRNTKDHIQLPDIDIDVPKHHRNEVIQYLKDKYGHDHVAQMSTFSKIKGRVALKDVLRVHGGMEFTEMNKITKCIPDEARIADQLQKMKDETGSSSIIRWCLENREISRLWKEWCWLNKETKELEGPLARKFEQAIRLEETRVSQSRHAAGIVIAPRPLRELVPLIYDKELNEHVCGVEMSDGEVLGVVKFDILGLLALDKIMAMQERINKGK